MVWIISFATWGAVWSIVSLVLFVMDRRASGATSLMIALGCFLSAFGLRSVLRLLGWVRAQHLRQLELEDLR